MNLEKHIGYWLRFVSNHVSNSFASKLSSHEISVAEWVILNLINEQSDSPTTIAKMSGMTKGATSKVLNKMFEKHLIERLASPIDRRYQKISLSKKGKTLLPKLMALADENDEQFFGHLSIEQKKQIMKFLAAIAEKNKWKDIPIS